MKKKNKAETKKKNKVTKEKDNQKSKKRGVYKKGNFMSLTLSGKKQRVLKTIDHIKDKNEAILVHSSLLKKFPNSPVRKMSVLWLIKKLRLREGLKKTADLVKFAKFPKIIPSLGEG